MYLAYLIVKKGSEKMNNNNIYSPYNGDPNKKKKCSCEDKYGPKPFTPNQNNKNNKKLKRLWEKLSVLT